MDARHGGDVRDERCLDYKALAEKLGRSESTMQKEWRLYPHFFVGRGRNLKSARFDFEEVLSDLKEKARGIQAVQRAELKVPDRPDPGDEGGSPKDARRFDVFRNVRGKS